MGNQAVCVFACFCSDRDTRFIHVFWHLAKSSSVVYSQAEHAKLSSYLRLCYVHCLSLGYLTVIRWLTQIWPLRLTTLNPAVGAAQAQIKASSAENPVLSKAYLLSLVSISIQPFMLHLLPGILPIFLSHFIQLQLSQDSLSPLFTKITYG